MMRNIVNAHFPDIDQELLTHAISAFYRLRDLGDIEKRPATRELLNWLRALKADPDFHPRHLKNGRLPYLGVLFKKSGDYERAARFAEKRGV
jgi:MoxR-like ATPase